MNEIVLNALDIVLLSILSVLFVIGLVRGLIRQLFSLIALAGSIILAVLFYDVGANYLIALGLFSDNSVATVVSFASIAIIYYLMIQIVAWMLTKLIGKLNLSWLNRVAGGASGVVIGIVISHFILSGSLYFITKEDPLLKQSIVAPYVEKGYAIIKSNVPEDLREHYEKSVDYYHKKRSK